jgi:PII interaction protein X
MLYRVAPAGEARDLYATLSRHYAEQNLARSRRDGPEVLKRWRDLFDQTFI